MSARSPRKSARQGSALYTIDNYSPDESIGLLIGMVRSQMMAALDDELAEVGLTGAQLPVLYWIDKTPHCTAAALCRRLGTDTGSMTRMIRRLETKGFVRRLRHADDRRAVHLELTTAGRAVRPMIIPRIVRVLNHSLQGFSPQELDLLKSLLRRMLANL